VPAHLPFHLARGATGPVQQSPVTCGSASLTVARMLVDPDFAAWIVDGAKADGGPPDSRPESARFAEHEREVMNRTNALHAAGGKLNLPWPHSLGTPPWGAEKELQHNTPGQPGAPGARGAQGAQGRAGPAYRMRVVRLASGAGLRDAYRDLVSLVREDLPALLYIGSSLSPRHVTLVLPGEGGAQLDVYDPATGSVTDLDPARFAARTLGIAGWNVPWIAVQPRG
jgi:hypothetical protein